MWFWAHMWKHFLLYYYLGYLGFFRTPNGVFRSLRVKRRRKLTFIKFNILCTRLITISIRSIFARGWKDKRKKSRVNCPCLSALVVPSRLEKTDPKSLWQDETPWHQVAGKWGWSSCSTWWRRCCFLDTRPKRPHKSGTQDYPWYWNFYLV